MLTFRSLSAAAVLTASLTVGGPALAASSAPIQSPAAAKTSITVKANLTEYQMGATYAGKDNQMLVVTGKAKALAGTKIKLQWRRQDSTKWTTTNSTKVDKSGSFTFKDHPSSTGTRSYRVIGENGAQSRSFPLDVWRWEPLTSRTGPLENVKYASVSFANEADLGLLQTEAGKPAFAEYTVAAKCRELTAEVGLNDSSLTGATGTMSISKDGTKILDKSLSVGVGERVTVDITSAQRVRFDATSSPDPKGYAAIRAPYVLCH